AAVVGVVAVHGRGGGDGGAGLVVVRAVLLVHPHDEPAGGGVVDDLRALDVGDVELGVGRLGEDVVAELPVLQVGGPVDGDGPEGVVGIAVLAEPVVIAAVAQHAAAVGVQDITAGVAELGAILNGHRSRVGGCRGIADKGAGEQH